MEKLQQFLKDEQELLADFLLDTKNAEGNKEYTRAAALWSAQTARVGAIKDVFALLGVSEEEEPLEHYCENCGETTLYLDSEIQAADVAERIIDCRKCGNVTRL